MTKQEKRERDLSIARFHLASWEKAKKSYEKNNKTENVKEADEKINFYSDEIENLIKE